jgi:hypothetical protein
MSISVSVATRADHQQNKQLFHKQALKRVLNIREKHENF